MRGRDILVIYWLFVQRREVFHQQPVNEDVAPPTRRRQERHQQYPAALYYLQPVACTDYR
jgi:hypothetical protein